MSARKKVIFLGEGHRHSSPIPEAIVAGGFVFLSAVRGVDPSTGKPAADVEKQAQLLFQNMKLALNAAGAELADVVKIAVYMMDLQGDRPVFNRVWAEHFGDEPPARFAVQVLDMGTTDDGSRFLADVTALAPA
jgi:2-iminobutanoate/2-iminopropanoate deaminase